MIRSSSWLFSFLTVVAVSIPAAAQGGHKEFEVYQSVGGGWSKNLHEIAKGAVNIPAPAQPVFLGRIPFTGTDTDRPDPHSPNVCSGSVNVRTLVRNTRTGL